MSEEQKIKLIAEAKQWGLGAAGRLAMKMELVKDVLEGRQVVALLLEGKLK